MGGIALFLGRPVDKVPPALGGYTGREIQNVKRYQQRKDAGMKGSSSQGLKP